MQSELSLERRLVQFTEQRLHEKRTELCEILRRNGSDKSTIHNYSTLYSYLFPRDAAITVFELGLGTRNVDIPSNMGPHGRPGASLYAFSEYFVNARLYGADIDDSILFQDPEKRIETFYVDQTSPHSIKRLWEQLPNIQFDLMIDDGLHEPHANIALLENSWHKLNLGGVYIIEDIGGPHLDDIQTYLGNLSVAASFKTLLRFAHPTNDYDNSIVILQK